jgi:hypothetical protein
MVQMPLYIVQEIKYIKILKNPNGSNAAIYSVGNKIHENSKKFK